jgi:uncharacterized protein YicC (UPF0701 family)
MANKKEETQQPPQPDNVDQIREILFGNQIRAVDERFQTVEKRMSKESENLRKTLEKRIFELENLLGQFRDNAGDQVNRESAERDAAINEVSKSLAAFRLDAENQLAELQSDFNSEIKQVRKEMLVSQETLMDGLASLQKTQTERSDLLDKSKVDRGELAGFLTGIAEQLSPPAKKRGK